MPRNQVAGLATKECALRAKRSPDCFKTRPPKAFTEAITPRATDRPINVQLSPKANGFCMKLNPSLATNFGRNATGSLMNPFVSKSDPPKSRCIFFPELSTANAAKECMCRQTAPNIFAGVAATRSSLPTSMRFFARKSKVTPFLPTPSPSISKVPTKRPARRNAFWSCSRRNCNALKNKFSAPTICINKVAEGVGFEPTVALRLRLISSQVPSTTQPPFHYVDFIILNAVYFIS